MENRTKDFSYQSNFKLQPNNLKQLQPNNLKQLEGSKSVLKTKKTKDFSYRSNFKLQPNNLKTNEQQTEVGKKAIWYSDHISLKSKELLKSKSYSKTYSLLFNSNNLANNQLIVTHNLNSLYNIIQVYNENNELTFPDMIQMTDLNHVQINFTSLNIVGNWKVIIISV